MGFLSHWAYQQAHLLNGKLYDLSLHDERTRSVAVWGRYIYSVCSYPHIVGRYKSHTGNCGIMSGEFLRHTDWIVSGTCGMRIGTLTNIWRSMGYQACAYQTGATSTSSWTPWESVQEIGLCLSDSMKDWQTISLKGVPILSKGICGHSQRVWHPAHKQQKW